MDAEEKKLYKEFCKEAQYMKEFGDKPYIIHANGKLLMSAGTGDLFEQYLKELKH
jgi:hypothetical protein